MTSGTNPEEILEEQDVDAEAVVDEIDVDEEAPLDDAVPTQPDEERLADEDEDPTPA